MAEDEVYFLGKKFISLKRASHISGYAKDYIGQLCRGGKIKAERVGRDWFVEVDSLITHKKLMSRKAEVKLESFKEIGTIRFAV